MEKIKDKKTQLLEYEELKIANIRLKKENEKLEKIIYKLTKLIGGK